MSIETGRIQDMGFQDASARVLGNLGSWIPAVSIETEMFQLKRPAFEIFEESSEWRRRHDHCEADGFYCITKIHYEADGFCFIVEKKVGNGRSLGSIQRLRFEGAGRACRLTPASWEWKTEGSACFSQTPTIACVVCYRLRCLQLPSLQAAAAC